MKRVVVIGAGVGGLTVAYRLSECRDIETILLEREREPGGRARSMTLPEGFVADNSAQFLATSYRHTLRIVRELGLEDDLVEVDEKTFISVYRKGELIALPSSVGGLMSTRALSRQSKLALLRLGFTALLRYRPGACLQPAVLTKHDDINLGELIENQYGKEVLEVVVQPSIGMSMGEAEEVSLAYGLALAPISLAKHLVLRGGNGTLTKALAGACPTLRGGVEVTRVAIDDQRVRGVETEDGDSIEADAVVCAAPAYQATPMLEGLGEEGRSFLESVPYSACVQVLFGMDRPSLPFWGVAIPRDEGSFISSVTEESFKSPDRAPEGKGLLQAFVIGDSARELIPLDDETISERVLEELRSLLPALSESPLFSRVIRRPQAMVLAEPGYLKRLAKFNDSVSRIDGLELLSDHLSTPLIEASVALGERIAQNLRSDLS